MNILAASCIFPSGPGMALADVALQVQMSLFRRHPIYKDRAGQPVSGSFFPEPSEFNHVRWQELAIAALNDLHAQLPVPLTSMQQAVEFDLWLVLPPVSRPGVPPQILEQLHAVFGSGPYQFRNIKTLHGGHSAGVVALQEAQNALVEAAQKPKVPRNMQDFTAPMSLAIVLAVDSWAHHDALLWLESHDLLHNAGKPHDGRLRNNPYGRIPGEAAAAIMLGLQPQGWCQVRGIGLAQESVLHTDTRPCTGQGWTQAANQALNTLDQDTKVTHVFSDLNGEPYRADQFGFTSLRISDRLQENCERFTPALVTGDIGTASAIAHMALSAKLLQQNKQTHLLLSSSDDSLRGAVVLAG